MIATPEYLQGSALWHRYQSEGLLQIRPAPVCAVAEKVMPDVRNPQLTLCQERRSALSLRLFPIGRPRAAAEKCMLDVRNDNRSALKLTLRSPPYSLAEPRVGALLAAAPGPVNHLLSSAGASASAFCLPKKSTVPRLTARRLPGAALSAEHRAKHRPL